MIKNKTIIENTNEAMFIIAIPNNVEINKKTNKKSDLKFVDIII